MVKQEIEGTWEELLIHSPALMGHRVKITVFDDEPVGFNPFHEEVSLEDAVKRIENSRMRNKGKKFSDSTDIVREYRRR